MKTEITREQVRKELEGSGLWKTYWNHLDVSGQHTQTLLSILSQETIMSILRVYRMIEHLKNEIDRQSYLYKSDAPPEKDFDRIKKILQKHCTKFETYNKDKMKATTIGWIDNRGLNDIMNYIKKTFMLSHKGFNYLAAEAKEKYIKLFNLSKQIAPYNFAVYLLADHLKAKQKRINWDLIVNFLIEQKAIDKNSDVNLKNKLRESYRKINKTNLEKHYDFYRECHIYPERKADRNLSFEQRHEFIERARHMTDIHLPPWTELLPITE